MIEPASTITEIMFALLGLIIVVVFFGLRRQEERRALLAIAVASYTLKAVLVPLYYWFLIVDGVEGFAFWDTIGYHYNSIKMAHELVNELPRESIGWRYSDPGYNVICAMLYMIFGSSTLIVRLFNSIVSTFTLLYVHRIARMSFDARVAKIAVRLAAFLPYPILMTVNHRKEATVILVATFLFYHALRILTKQRGWERSIVTLIPGLAAIYFLRGGFVLPFLGLLFVMFISTQRSLVQGMFLSILVIVGLVGVQIAFPDSQKLDVQSNIESLGARLEYTAREVQQSGGLLRYVKVTSALDAWKIPIAGFLLIILPFPPFFPQAGQLMYPFVLAFSHMVYLLFLPQLFLGTRELFRANEWKRRLPLFIYTGGFLLVIGALSVGVMRYRETVIPVLLVITAAGFTVRQNFLWAGAFYVGLFLMAALVNLHRYWI